MLPSVGDGLTVKAIERKEGLECARSARLGPSGVGRPRVVGRKKAWDDPETGQERGMRGWGIANWLNKNI